MATDVDAARLLVRRSATLKDAGEPFIKEASMAKLFASRVAMDSADKAVQIHGGAGYFAPTPRGAVLPRRQGDRDLRGHVGGPAADNLPSHPPIGRPLAERQDSVTTRTDCVARHINHVCIAVSDIEATVVFYQRVFGVGEAEIEDVEGPGSPRLPHPHRRLTDRVHPAHRPGRRSRAVHRAQGRGDASHLLRGGRHPGDAERTGRRGRASDRQGAEGGAVGRDRLQSTRAPPGASSSSWWTRLRPGGSGGGVERHKGAGREAGAGRPRQGREGDSARAPGTRAWR